MTIKFSSTLTLQYPTPFSAFTPGQFAEGLQWLKDSEFDGAEICISNYNDLDPRKVKEQVSSYGLGISTISTGQALGLEHISLLEDDDARVKKAQERLMQHIDAAKVFGSKVTLGLLRGVGTHGNEAADKKRMAKNLEPVIRHAEDQGVTVDLECINRYETALFNDVASTVDFIKNELAGAKCMGILWDIFHANIEDPDYEGAIELLDDRLKHVHVADSNRMFPGYGHTDFPHIVKLLKQAGFNDYMSFECFNRPTREIVLEKSREWINAMRAV